MKRITLFTFFSAILTMASLHTRAQDGYALDFDGTDDFVALPMSYTTSGIQELSVCGWVRLFGDGGGWSVIDFDRSEYFNLEVGWNDRSTSVVNFATTDNSGAIHDMQGTVNVRDGSWHFICAVFDGTDKYIYVDGVQDAVSLNPHGGLPLGTGTARYGFIGDGSEAPFFNGSRNNFYFDGLVDNVSVWDTVLDPAWINDIMNNGIPSPATQPNLEVYYDFNDGSGQMLTDLSANNYTGQLGNSFGSDNADPFWQIADDDSGQYTFDFNGSDDYGLILNSPLINTGGPYSNRTIEVWFFAKNINKTTPQVIYEEGGAVRGFNIYIQSGALYVGGWNENETSWQGTFLSTSAISDQRWHHVVARLRNGTGSLQPDKFKGYLDGVEFGSGPGTEVYAHSGDICIARNGSTKFHTGDDSSVGEYFEGMVEELRIWDNARTTNQIRQNIHRELMNPESQSTLIAYHKFNEYNGRFAWDHSESGHPVQLYDISYSDWIPSTAPIPYFTVQNGAWNNDAVWATGQFAPNTEWSRVMVDHDVQVTSEVITGQLTVENNGSVSIEPFSALTVEGILTNLSGNDGIVVVSDASGAGSLIHNTPDVDGTVEQYLTEEQWHYVSSPIANGLSGVYLDIYLIDWSEPDSVWTFIVPVNIPLQVTRGYGAWASSGITGTTTVYYEGVLNNGDKAASLTYNNGPGEGQGWNFVGNPFPSALEWNANWSAANVDATAYFWDGSNYLTWNRLTELGTAPSGEIPMTQGFFIKANGASPALAMPQSERIHGGQAFYKSGGDRPLIRIAAEGNNHCDEAIIYFDPAATNAFDNDLDAYELGGVTESPQIYSMWSGEELTVNALPETGEEVIIPMGFEAGVYNKYMLTMKDEVEVATYYMVVLEDLKENKTVNLTEAGAYGFTGDPNDDPDRFLLKINPVNEYKSSGTVAGSCDITAIHGGLEVRFQGMESGSVYVYSLLGQTLYNKEFDNESILQISDRAIEQNAGIIVKVVTESYSYTKKLFIK